MRACSAAKSCLTLGGPMDCSPPGSSVRGISQARILEWAAIPFFMVYSQTRDRTCISYIGQTSSLLLSYQGSPETRSVQSSPSVMSDSLRPHGLQHARLPCPSPTPGAYSLMPIESVMPSNHLILCRPFFLMLFNCGVGKDS